MFYLQINNDDDLIFIFENDHYLNWLLNLFKKLNRGNYE